MLIDKNNRLQKPLSSFLQRLPIEGEKTFTWLIGAGVSVSAGIPSARNISKRLILFDYLVNNNQRPWDQQNNLRATYNDLTTFLAWYDDQEIILDEAKRNEFDKLFEKALKWLNQYNSAFENITYDSPECYQLLFQHLLQDSTLHHDFITSIVRRSKGVNLAHLCLAGLLRDHFKRGHTVFTTNFDDLLLKALLSINHTARVFGDTDLGMWQNSHLNYRISTIPSHPQIVHLHGRHTGYMLRNTHDQVFSFDVNLQSEFKNHLAHSDNLIVLGYSGWDDMVMQTLREWPTNTSLLKGNLYWVPYIEDGNISLLDSVESFLKLCPLGKAFILTNSNLNADSFMLELCKSLNYNGFVPYRKEIIDTAKIQHVFILNQLSDHPIYDPNKAIEYVDEAKNLLKNGHIADSLKCLQDAINLVKDDDLPTKLQAKIYLEAAIIFMAHSLVNEAIKYLKISIKAWDEINAKSNWGEGKIDNEVKIKKADALRALAECKLKQGHVLESSRHLKAAEDRYLQLSHGEGLAYTKLLKAVISIQSGQYIKARSALTDSSHFFYDTKNSHGLFQYSKLMGDTYRIEKRPLEAIQCYEEALNHCDLIENDLFKAELFRCLALAYSSDKNFKEAESYFKLSRNAALKINNNNNVCNANLENSLGDFFMIKGNIKLAFQHFQLAYELYKKSGDIYGQANALADLLKLNSIYVELGKDNNIYISDLNETLTEVNNIYANSVLSRNLDLKI